MLDMLLNAPNDKRKALLKKLNAGTKKRIFDQIYTMTEELGLDDIPDFETRVKMRHELIQRFPDRVFWDYAEWASSGLNQPGDGTPDFERYPSCKISTRGEAIVFDKMKRLAIRVVEPKANYRFVCVAYKHKTRHRLIASTFIPRPDRLKHIPYRKLYVNHIDGTRWYDNINNLEWVRATENVRHAFNIDRYDEEIFFLFKVLANNAFEGQEFILSEHDLHHIGVSFASMRKSIVANDTFKGFRVTQIRREDIGDMLNDFPSEIVALFNKNTCYFNHLLIPLIGTVLRGRFKGLEFSLFGATEITKYFSRGSVNLILAGKQFRYRGCTFRYATHKEAIPLHGKLTKEIADDARNAKDP